MEDAAPEANPSAHAVAAAFGLAVLETVAGEEPHAARTCQLDLAVDAAGAEFGFDDMMESAPRLVAEGRGRSRLDVEVAGDETQVCELDWKEVGGYV